MYQLELEGFYYSKILGRGKPLGPSESATIDGEMEVIIYQKGGSKLVDEHINSCGVYTYEVNPEEDAECRIEVGIFDVVLLVNSITIEYRATY